MRLLVPFFILSFAFFARAQDIPNNFVSRKIAVADTITIDSVSINSAQFNIKMPNGNTIDTTRYKVDFSKALLVVENVDTDSIIVEYLRYPDFLTKRYAALDKSIIVDNPRDLSKLYSLRSDNRQPFSPFAGLSTSGSITRGITIGNNQNSVLNSQLDLQISGKLSDKVTLRASIQDANIPLQESGYSQRLDEFDQVFIELESDRWKIRAGDVNLADTDSYFMRFQKKVQGVSINANLPHENSSTSLYASGAVVRGRYTQSQFQAQEGNQGPYKLLGPNNELFILIISGSETVYVNGLPLKRGENNDYVIDYNAGEIRFNPTFPITSDMRITVDYQFTDNNYTRFVAFGGAKYESEKFFIGGQLYSENDAKNQPIQQNLSEEQVAILGTAGDDQRLMVAPSAIEDTFSENKILYRKEDLNGTEIFVFSNDPEDELFNVRFSLVGQGQGNYILANNNAIGRIFEFVAPINGMLQGNYEPVVQLSAPNKLQLAVVNGGYDPSERTSIRFEAAVSNNDQNLFSDIDDEDNEGLGVKLNLKQNLIDKAWKLDGFANYDFVDENFRNLEGIYQVEFNRDWNLPILNNSRLNQNSSLGTQHLITGGLQLVRSEKGTATYQYERLEIDDLYTGDRHIVSANLSSKRFKLQTNNSILNSDSNTSESTFFRSNGLAAYGVKKAWVGAAIHLEDNQEKVVVNDSLTPISQRFYEYNPFLGVGDSTGIYAEIGYRYRTNDSIQSNRLQRFNTSNTYYIRSQLLKGKNAQLQLFASYRDFDYVDEAIADEQSLNSRALYNQRIWKDKVRFNIAYETNSGTQPQQEFTFVQVDPGQGTFVWVDYNNNGIQELDEFEVAQFQDQAEYIRVLLPNQVFIKTHQNKFSQNLTLNPASWSNESGVKKLLSHFYNQTSYIIDRKIRREGDNFNLNPFESGDENLLGLSQNLRNTIYYNRGKQKFTTVYNYLLNKGRSQLSTGSQTNNLFSHQLQFTHKFQESWLITLTGLTSTIESAAENFLSRNFEIDTYRLNPKLSYLFGDNARFDVFYEFRSRENQVGDMETLDQQKLGASFSISKSQKTTVMGEFNFFRNDFVGNAFSPVGYQMLEGLQPGNNMTWNLLAQRQLTKFLDLNLNYQGRKSENSRTIHTGNIQLKAYF